MLKVGAASVRELRGHRSVGEQARLVERGQRLDQLADALRVGLGIRLVHSRQHSPERGDPRRVRRDVFVDGLARHLVVVDGLFDEV